MSKKTEDKSATVEVKLKADSGYECEVTHRISHEQWQRIDAILNE